MRGFTGQAFVILLSFAVATIQGCNALEPRLSGSERQRGMLPDIFELDRIVSSEGINSSFADLALPLESVHATAFEGTLSLTAPESELAYAVYAFDPPDEANLLSLKVEGDQGIWLLAANFSSGRWSDAVELDLSSTQINLDEQTDWISPSGLVFAAVVTEPEVAAVLKKLWLETFTPSHEPVTYYVSVQGDNILNNGSESEPWETLQFAVDNIQPGDTIRVRAGEYAGFRASLVGTSAQPIRIEAEAGASITREKSTLPAGIFLEDSAYVTIDGFTISGAFQDSIQLQSCLSTEIKRMMFQGSQMNIVRILESDHISILESEFAMSQSSYGVRVEGYCTSCSISKCSIYNASQASIAFSAVSAASSIWLRMNTFHAHPSFSGYTVILKGTSAADIQNNQFMHKGRAIVVDDSGAGFDSSGTNVVNNTFIGGQSGVYCIKLLEGCGDVGVFNNIICGPEGTIAFEMQEELMPLLTSNNNCMMNAVKVGLQNYTIEEWSSLSGQDTNSVAVTSDMVFMDFEAEDFRPAGPALDLALPEYAPAEDLAGNARPFGAGYDCGCFELMELLTD